MTEPQPEPQSAPPTREEKREEARRRKSAARLFAVQALYQMEATGRTVDQTRIEFETHRFGEVFEDHEMAEGNVDLFEGIIERAVERQSFIDQATDRALVERWPLGRIDPTLRALFRAAGAEMLGDTPPKVVIVEFVKVAEAFFPDGREPKLVNGVLDHMAREIRAEAFEG